MLKCSKMSSQPFKQVETKEPLTGTSSTPESTDHKKMKSFITQLNHTHLHVYKTHTYTYHNCYPKEMVKVSGKLTTTVMHVSKHLTWKLLNVSIICMSRVCFVLCVYSVTYTHWFWNNSLSRPAARHRTLGYLVLGLPRRSVRVQELCKSQGGRPGLSVLMSLTVSAEVKQHWTMLQHWSQFVPNISTHIKGQESLHHHHHQKVCDAGLPLRFPWMGKGCSLFGAKATSAQFVLEQFLKYFSLLEWYCISHGLVPATVMVAPLPPPPPPPQKRHRKRDKKRSICYSFLRFNGKTTQYDPRKSTTKILVHCLHWNTIPRFRFFTGWSDQLSLPNAGCMRYAVH